MGEIISHHRGQLNSDALRTLRRLLAEHGFRSDFDWAESVVFPACPEDLTGEYAFVVVNSGMKATVARGIYDRLWPAILAGRSASTEFGHQGKCAAIDRGWLEREAWYAAAAQLTGAPLVEWCGTRPWVGPITKWHLAKNLGADVAKPDRWLVRLAESHGETVEGLCDRLAKDLGWRVGTVDVVLWRACALGLCRPVPGAGVALRDPQGRQ